jgi:hypothetical protein
MHAPAARLANARLPEMGNGQTIQMPSDDADNALAWSRQELHIGGDGGEHSTARAVLEGGAPRVHVQVMAPPAWGPIHSRASAGPGLLGYILEGPSPSERSSS